MRMHPADVQYVFFPAAPVRADYGPLEVSADGGLTWAECTWLNIDTDPVARVLMAGPQAAAPAGAVLLAAGRTLVATRLRDTPEVVHDGPFAIDVRE